MGQVKLGLEAAPHVTAASFKFKYAAIAFLVVLLAAAAVVALFLVRHDSDTRTLGTLAEAAARERVTPELAARAQDLAVHAADSIAGAVRAGDASGMVRRLQPFVDNPSVAAITVTSTAGKPLFDYRRGEARPAGALSSAARRAGAYLRREHPGGGDPGDAGESHPGRWSRPRRWRRSRWAGAWRRPMPRGCASHGF